MTAFIFDVDGTIAETERYGHRIAFNRAFAEAGLNWYWSESVYGELLAISGGKERISHYIYHYLPDYSPPEPLDKFIQELHAAKSNHYRQILQGGKIPLRPGVKRLLTEAQSVGIRLAIATTSSLENTTALLESQLKDTISFEIIAAGDIVANKKPAPDIYHYVLRRMNISPKSALAFEDSQQGVLAATRAGLKTIVTLNDYTKTQNFSSAALVLSDLGEPDQPFTVYSDYRECQQTYFDVAFGKQLLNTN